MNHFLTCVLKQTAFFSPFIVFRLQASLPVISENNFYAEKEGKTGFILDQAFFHVPSG